MPDYVECITAWRAWDVRKTPEGLRLESIGRSARWEPRQPHNATCLRSKGLFGEILNIPSHASPGFNCACGIWGFKDKDLLLSKLTRSYADFVKVLGTVSLWGRCVETEHGWRAEHAYPAQLDLLQRGLTDLSWIYNVPIRSL